METDKLTAEKIVAEALELLQECGIERMSMRQLARRLSIRAPTLYWYFPDKAAILRAVIKTLFERAVSTVPPTSTWQDWMRGFGAAIWQMNKEVPYTPLLLRSPDANNAEVFEFVMKRIDAKMKMFDVDMKRYARAHSDVQAFVLGWSVFAHSDIAPKVESLVDLDTAVLEGVDMIVRYWEDRLSDVPSPQDQGLQATARS